MLKHKRHLTQINFNLFYHKLGLPKDIHVWLDPEPRPLGQSHPPAPLLCPCDGPCVHGVIAVEVRHREAELGRDTVGQMENGSGPE